MQPLVDIARPLLDRPLVGQMSVGSAIRTAALARRGIASYLTDRPLCASFEITRRCNARCEHCHLGGPVPGEVQASAERYGEVCREIDPVVAQVSGGEPLLRKDVEAVVRALRRPYRSPYIVLTTNAALLTRDRYERLVDAGVNEISVSFDFPDERLDGFRRLPGLHRKIERLVREVGAAGRNVITFNCVIQRRNYHDLERVARVATDWGVRLNFSAYTFLRTNDKDLMIRRDDLPELHRVIDRLLEHRERHGNIYASEYVLRKMAQYFADESIPSCLAGTRFVIVNPDATLSPCGLILKSFATREELVERFTKHNTCTSCYTSLRANTERPAAYLLADSLRILFA